jgi:hypothetical protein
VNPAARAYAKFRDSTASTVGTLSAAPAGGYTLLQAFNTTTDTKEVGEPNHCGEAGGASRDFTYQPPVSGTVMVDTAGSAFNNVLAVYSGPGDSYATLVAVTCSKTNNAAGGEAVTFSGTGGTTYFIYVDGVGGAKGAAVLNISLAAPPVFTNQPYSRTVVAGSNVTLLGDATGTPPLAYQWRTNGVPYAGRVTNSLTVTNFQATHEGAYDLVITNTVGAVTSSAAQLYFLATSNSLRFTNAAWATNLVTTNRFSATLLGVANSNYIVQVTTNFTNWANLRTNAATNGIYQLIHTNPASSNLFYRARSF